MLASACPMAECAAETRATEQQLPNEWRNGALAVLV